MANNGFKQATIAYKVSKPDGYPLDINGELTSVSLRPQAIFLLEGTTNPNTALYEVEGYFTAGGEIAGTPTQEYDPDDCPADGIWISPAQITLLASGAAASVSIYSSGPWEFVSGPTTIAAVTPLNGPAGFSFISVTPTATTGQGPFIFKNTLSQATAQLYVINTNDPSIWILATGFWNDLGFWFDNGVWNY